MLNQDPIKAIKYFWNEEIGKGQNAHAINLWNGCDTEEQWNKKFNTHTMRDDDKDGEKEKKTVMEIERGRKIKQWTFGIKKRSIMKVNKINS